MDEIKQLQMQVQELSQNVTALLLSDKTKDKSILNLESEIEKIKNNRIEDKILNKEIMMRLDYLTGDMKYIKNFIEEQKEQPAKDKKDFIKQVIGTIIGLSIGSLFTYLGIKK